MTKNNFRTRSTTRRTTDYPAMLILEIRSRKLPIPVREYQGIPGRKFRYDLAWPAKKLALEVQGGVFSGGRHTRGIGYTADCEKLNLTVLNGWRMLWVTPAHIRDGKAIRWVEQALKMPPDAIGSRRSNDL